VRSFLVDEMLSDELRLRIQWALSEEPRLQRLTEVVSKALRAGSDPNQVYDLLLESQRANRAPTSESVEDALTDVMDRMVGWCAPGTGLVDPPLRRAGGIHER
jgi:hypothetical protein